MSRMFREPKFWIGTVSREHGLNAVKEGIVQVCHGKQAPLKRMQAGDWFAYYSPKEGMRSGDTVQRFVSIGRIVTGDVYQVEQFPGFKPFRIDVDFMQCEEAPIKPLIESLDFIKNKQNWGMAFRFGCLEASKKDFIEIAQAMKVDLDNPVPDPRAKRRVASVKKDAGDMKAARGMKRPDDSGEAAEETAIKSGKSAQSTHTSKYGATDAVSKPSIR